MAKSVYLPKIDVLLKFHRNLDVKIITNQPLTLEEQAYLDSLPDWEEEY